ncbi:MAG: Hdr-like menaquinol oxidoreductase cytochrome c subunit [Alphaproteobacteria bacterium]|nr:MAG: Hdr-like menaquinol oxidoreductase cytochrome c subunit [Alphaproteobacteria bacterium]
MRLVLAFLAAIGFAGGAAAGGSYPAVPAATGDPHPEGNDYWRLHHMDLLQHDRDKTVREGIRNLSPDDVAITASIGTCFDCHAVKDEQGEYVSFDDPRHFCRVCHDYAAVTIDCFECHRSTPANTTAYRTMAKPEDPDSIVAYLARLAQETSQ